jgi:toxin ParE1/3/4
LPSSKPLRLSAPARRDLAHIAAHSEREWGAAQKRKYLGEIKEKLAQLRHAPAMGAPRDDIANGLRACPVRHHIVFYRDQPDWVEIVRILHQSMDPVRRLGGE